MQRCQLFAMLVHVFQVLQLLLMLCVLICAVRSYVAFQLFCVEFLLKH